VKLAGLPLRALYGGVLRLDFLARVAGRWPTGVDAGAGTWLVTGVDHLLRALFSPQPPEGAFAARLGDRLQLVARFAPDPSPPPTTTAVPELQTGEGPWPAFLRGERRHGLADGEALVRARGFFDAERARVLQATVGGPVWQRGATDFAATLQQGRLQVAPDDAAALWALVQRDPSLRGAFIARRYLYLLPPAAFLDAALQPSTWAALPADARAPLEHALGQTLALASPTQRERLAALAATRPSLQAQLPTASAQRVDVVPFERLWGQGAAVDRARVLAVVDDATGRAPYVLDVDRVVVDDRVVTAFVDGLVDRLQRRAAARPPDATTDLWDDDDFRLAWLVLQAWVAGRRRTGAGPGP